MKFEIYRATQPCYKDAQKPCANAYKEFGPDKWEIGSYFWEGNERFERKEEALKKHWYVDINTLEDLLKLREEVGEPLTINNPEDKDKQSIQIYDGYIE